MIIEYSMFQLIFQLYFKDDFNLSRMVYPCFWRYFTDFPRA